ncbi:unnamed protein product [Schistocephalus solidus]|uniref:Uncharacterized protein n=1 Tax=Schistocephalus solidus TaxID=70667 RepID=A0A183SLY2_SCHSO|nr:unnamed protein product [Schistocephalus solidus]
MPELPLGPMLLDDDEGVPRYLQIPRSSPVIFHNGYVLSTEAPNDVVLVGDRPYSVGTGRKIEVDGITEDLFSNDSHSQFPEDTSSLASSAYWRPKSEITFSKFLMNDKLSSIIRQDIQQPLVVRTSSLANRRSNSKETVIHSDETKSLFPSTASHLQAPLLSLDEISSFQSTTSSDHLSSADLSSLHSCSAMSVPVVLDRNRSLRRTRAVTVFGYSPSNFAQTDSSSRFSSSLNRIDQTQAMREMQLSPIIPPRIVSPDVVEEFHKLHLQL